MLDALKRAIGGKADAVAEQVIALAAHEALQSEFASYKEQAESLLSTAVSEKAELATKLESAQAELSEALAQLETLKQFAEAAEAAAAQAAAEAAATKLNARKTAIVAAVGTGRADALMAATESLDDAAFDAIVSAMSMSVETEAKTGMFAEQGATVDASAAPNADESPEMKILKAKYKTVQKN